MRRFSFRSVLVLVAWITAASLTGCSNSNDVIQTGVDPSVTSDTEADVQAGAQVMAASAPSADVAAEAIVGMLAVIQPAPGIPTGPADPSQQGSPSCFPNFDLGNGIVGTCVVAGTGEVTLTFSGHVDIDGQSVSVDGSLLATKSADQPPYGCRFDIDFSATTSGLAGDTSWSSSGSVTVDDAGRAIDPALSLTGTVTPASGPATTVTVAVDPTQFELTVTGPLGGVLRFAMDRATMTGVLTLNGIQVAGVSIVDGCAVVDSVVPELGDLTVC